MNNQCVEIVNNLKSSLPHCHIDTKYSDKIVAVEIYATFRGQIGWTSLWFDKENPGKWDVKECSKPEQLPEIRRTLSAMIGV